MYDNKSLGIIGSFITLIVSIPTLIHYLEKRESNALEAKKAELAAGYPPEYWEAEAEKAREHEATERAKVESHERLTLDERERATAEAEAKREFEQNAPDSYWQHLKTVEEEETRRLRDKQRHEAEMAAERRHQQAML